MKWKNNNFFVISVLLLIFVSQIYSIDAKDIANNLPPLRREGDYTFDMVARFTSLIIDSDEDFINNSFAR